MSKKSQPAAEKPAAKAEPQEAWNRAWSIHRRLLQARQDIKGTKLWETFSIHRDFDAFSIHSLANGVEDVLGALGVRSDFRQTKWEKSGNMTVVEGVWRAINVDDPADIYDLPVVGEGADGSDKGLNKAVTSARKLGMVSALNLGIGKNVEEENTQAEGPPPQQTKPEPKPAEQPKKAEDYVHPEPKPNGTNGAPLKTYTMQFRNEKARAVLSTGMYQTIWGVVQNAPTTESLEEWCKLNDEMLQEFNADQPEISARLQKLVQGKYGTLRDKGV